MRYLVRSGALIGFPELVEEHGQSPVALLDDVGIPLAALRDPELNISYTALARLMTLAAQRCNAPDFGARLGGRQGLEVVGALGTLLCLQAEMGEALQLIHRHVGFHARGVSIEVLTDAEHITLEMRVGFQHQLDCAQLNALSMALLIRTIAQLHGQALRPERVELAVPRPRELQGWRSAFTCLPVFDQAVSRVLYPLALFSMPVRISPSLRERLSAQWRGLAQRSDFAPSLAQQVERAIVALLPTGDCSLEQVARLLELAPRTLQQRLTRDALSFGLLLRQVRERLAREHLRYSDVEITALALNLGFGELAVFSRAFKSWTGYSPRQWRAAERP